MENRELRETLNIVEIVGTLKEKNLEYYTLDDGRESIRGNVVVEVKEGDKIHNHKIEVFSMKLNQKGNISGLFKGYETVMNEYKDKVSYPDEADRIAVQGSIDINDFMTNNGEFVSNNRISGLFFNRLAEERPDRAVGNLEVIINSKELTAQTDPSGLPTGNMVLNGYSVGYFNKKDNMNKIIPINDILISQGLYQQIKPYYLYGETVKISVALNNYAVVEKKEEPATTFGEVVDLDITNTYVNEIRMTGGEMPYQDDRKFNDEDKVLVEKYREAAVQDVKGANQASSFPTASAKDMEFTDMDNPNNVPDF